MYQRTPEGRVSLVTKTQVFFSTREPGRGLLPLLQPCALLHLPAHVCVVLHVFMCVDHMNAQLSGENAGVKESQCKVTSDSGSAGYTSLAFVSANIGLQLC